MPNQPPRIVVIDDDREHLQYLLDLLSAAGHDAVGFGDAGKALADIARSGADVVITDIFMPDTDGFEVLQHLQRTHPAIPVIAIDHALPGDEAFVRIIKSMGAFAGLTRPVDPPAILDAVLRALTRH